MKNKTFAIDFGIVGNGESYTLRIPIALYPEIEKAKSVSNEGGLDALVGIFECFSEMDDIKRMTTQAMIINRAQSLKTLDDMLLLVKTMSVCMEFFDSKDEEKSNIYYSHLLDVATQSYVIEHSKTDRNLSVLLFTDNTSLSTMHRFFAACHTFMRLQTAKV